MVGARARSLAGVRRLCERRAWGGYQILRREDVAAGREVRDEDRDLEIQVLQKETTRRDARWRQLSSRRASSSCHPLSEMCVGVRSRAGA